MSIPYNNQRYMPIIPIADEPKPKDWEIRTDTMKFAGLAVKKPQMPEEFFDSILLNDLAADALRLRRAWEKRHRKKQRNLRNAHSG